MFNTYQTGMQDMVNLFCKVKIDLSKLHYELRTD